MQGERPVMVLKQNICSDQNLDTFLFLWLLASNQSLPTPLTWTHHWPGAPYRTPFLSSQPPLIWKRSYLASWGGLTVGEIS